LPHGRRHLCDNELAQPVTTQDNRISGQEALL